jgi:hypothetical protein
VLEIGETVSLTVAGENVKFQLLKNVESSSKRSSGVDYRN